MPGAEQLPRNRSSAHDFQTSKVQGDCAGLAITSYQPCQQLAEELQAYWARSLNSPDKSAVRCAEQHFQNTSVSSTERTGCSWRRQYHKAGAVCNTSRWGTMAIVMQCPASPALQQVRQISKFQESRDFSEAAQ